MAEKGYPLKVVLSAVDKVTAPIKRINAKVAALSAPFRKINNAIRSLGEAIGIQRLSAAIGRVGGAARGVVHQFGALATKIGLLGGAGLFGLQRLIQSTADAGDAAAKTAQKAGISIAAWQEYVHAASLAGVSSDALKTAFRTLAVNSQEAARGMKSYLIYFKAAGISTKDLTQLKPDELFEKLADRISKMPDGLRKTAIAQRLLGRSGTELIPLLNIGSEAIRQQREEARRLGIVMTDVEAHAAEKFKDSQTRLKFALQGVRNIIGNALIPILTPLIKRMKDWIVANRALIKVKVLDFLAKLPGRLEEIRAGLINAWAATKPVRNVFKFLGERFGYVRVAAIALSAVILGPLVLSIFSLGKALFGLGAVLIANPVLGVIVLAIGAIAGAAYLIIKNWEPIKKWWSEFWGGIVGAVSDAWKRLTGLFDKIAKPFGKGGALGFLGLGKETARVGAGVGSAAAAGGRSTLQGVGGRGGPGGKGGEANVTVEIKNAPPGTKVKTGRTSGKVNMSVGYMMAEAQ